MENLNKIYYTYIFLNLLCMGTYGFDKFSAIKNWRRTSEKTLMIWALIAPFGAFWGMFIFRHKTRKWYFKIVILLFMAVHIFMGYKFLYLL